MDPLRKLLGDEGAAALLVSTSNVAVELELIQPEELQRVIVECTMQAKAIGRPVDSQLLETPSVKGVEVAKEAGIDLKQTYAKEGKALGR